MDLVPGNWKPVTGTGYIVINSPINHFRHKNMTLHFQAGNQDVMLLCKGKTTCYIRVQWPATSLAVAR